MSAAPYLPIWVKSHYSFLEGASSPESLVERAHALGLPGMVLSDRDGVYGSVRAHVRARELGLPLRHGAQVSVGMAQMAHALSRPEIAAGIERVLLVAIDRRGWASLCRLLTLGRGRCPKGSSLVTVEELHQHSHGLLALCLSPGLVAPLREAFSGRIYAVVHRHLSAEGRREELRMRAEASRLGVPCVAGHEVLYDLPSRRPLQDIMTCIRTGTTLSTAGRHLRGNAEHGLLTAAEMHERWYDDRSSLTRTLELIERTSFTLADLRYRYPEESLPASHNEGSWLRELTWRGAEERYGGEVPRASAIQLERELDLITELSYGGYFLTMWEIVRYCRSEGILCQGRGSAANSIVCYCLGITAIDPVRMDLLFERFLSRERAEAPDIDLDIEHERREQVIQWVYQRYGRRHAAMVANFVRYRARSAVRDVGKALGIPQAALDELARKLGPYDAEIPMDLADDSGLENSRHRHPGTGQSLTHLLRLAEELLEAPRHLSIHPGGFLLGHDAVDELVPIEPATMEDRTVIQWDKYDVDDLGLFKVDLLGLGALTQVRKAFSMLREQNIDLDMARVPAEDPLTYDMISRGDTVGVFQIESRAQMAMLPRLRPRNFYDLVIEVAIVRPGPIQGDMVHPYLRRRQGIERVELPHPSLAAVLGKTLGVPIFQEQVMKLAVAVAGYTPGEADRLRRDMGAWQSHGRIEEHRERLISRMIERGIAAEFAERVFSQIRGFAEYGFPESHAASFALIAYVTAWLRRHHPEVFLCSLLNSQPMGFYSAATLVEDGRHHGVEVRPVDIQRSAWDCTLERREDPGPVLPSSGSFSPSRAEEDGGLPSSVPRSSSTQRPPDDDKAPSRSRGGFGSRVEARGTWAVRIGLRYIKGLGVGEQERLAQEPPPYENLEDFVRRTRLERKALLALSEAGALESLESKVPHDRRSTLWRARGARARVDDQLPAVLAHSSFETEHAFEALSDAQAVLWDYRRTGHSARGHPVEAIRPLLRQRGLPDARQLADHRDGQATRFVGLVICRQRPQSASGVTFFTLEDETGFVNLVVWERVFDEHRDLARTASLLGVSGKVQRVDGVVHLIADTLWLPEVSLSTEGTRSRDFH